VIVPGNPEDVEFIAGGMSMSGLSEYWNKLTRSPVKAAYYERETWFREGWRDSCEILGSNLLGFLDDAALMLIKPDGLVAGKAAAIMDFVQSHGFEPVAVQTPVLTRLHWREMWRYQMTLASLDRLAVNDLILCGRSLLLALRRRSRSDVPATVELTELKGPSDVRRQSPGCLRRLIGQPNRLLSHFHVADEPADLVRELSILLDRRTRRTVLRAYAGQGRLTAGGQRRMATVLDESMRASRNLDAAESLARMEAAINEATKGERQGGRAQQRLQADLMELRRGHRIEWLAFMQALEAAGVRLDRWDLAVVGTGCIFHDDQGASRLVEAVDPASWRLPAEAMANLSPQWRGGMGEREDQTAIVGGVPCQPERL
jgi:hypothetical protein